VEESAVINVNATLHPGPVRIRGLCSVCSIQPELSC
jgi:hypothetical protein